MCLKERKMGKNEKGEAEVEVKVSVKEQRGGGKKGRLRGRLAKG